MTPNYHRYMLPMCHTDSFTKKTYFCRFLIVVSKLTFFIKHIWSVKTLARLNHLVIELAKDFGDPVKPSPAELESFFEGVRARAHIHNQFYLTENLKDNEVLFHWNTERYIDIKGKIDVNKVAELIHPKYLSDVLQWAMAGYACTVTYKHLILSHSHHYRVTFPMELKDGKYHWVQIDAVPLVFDKDGNILTHFNTYTVLNRPFNEKEKVAIVADITANIFPDEQLTRELRRFRFDRHPFILTPSQKQIVITKQESPEITNAELAKFLGKEKDTVDVQNKQILAKAKESFPARFPADQKHTVTDVVRFLDEMGYFIPIDELGT